MYARELNGKTLTLAVSGMLWNQSLVMYDKETSSLWCHILGESMRGPLRGKKLEQVPSVMTDWQTWSKLHPQGTVALLDRTSREFTRAFYGRREQFVLGIVEDGKARAWSFDFLGRNPTVNDKLGDKPVLVAFDRNSVTARLFERKLDRRVLTFQVKGGRLTDQETGSTWDPVTGRARTGELNGKYLSALPAIVSYRAVWQRFHPKSGIRAGR